MNVDELEDYLELRDPGLRKQIRRSQEQYRRGKKRDAGVFLAELRHAGPKSRK
jgi:PHD/YefM family antitoxin component YafN of YafNO toxin-antitoxin module